MIYPRQIIRFLRYLVVFIKELVMANIEVVKLVISPVLRIKPGFITVPMDAKTDFEITSLANSITLTPGTISVHVPNDRKSIVIHAIDIGDDPDELRLNIKASLEAGILDWTRKEGYTFTRPDVSDTAIDSTDSTNSTDATELNKPESDEQATKNGDE